MQQILQFPFNMLVTHSSSKKQTKRTEGMDIANPTPEIRRDRPAVKNDRTTPTDYR